VAAPIATFEPFPAFRRRRPGPFGAWALGAAFSSFAIISTSRPWPGAHGPVSSGLLRVTPRKPSFRGGGTAGSSVCCGCRRTRRWSARAHLCWGSYDVPVSRAYLVFMLQWDVPEWSSGSAAEIGWRSSCGRWRCWPASLGAPISGELVRRARDREAWASAGPGRRRPFGRCRVALRQLARCGLQRTVRQWSSRPSSSLKNLDYPNYEILAIDDNTGRGVVVGVRSRPGVPGTVSSSLICGTGRGTSSGAPELCRAGDDRSAGRASSGSSTPTTSCTRSFLTRCAAHCSREPAGSGFIQAPSGLSRLGTGSVLPPALLLLPLLLRRFLNPPATRRDGAIFRWDDGPDPAAAP